MKVEYEKKGDRIYIKSEYGQKRTNTHAIKAIMRSLNIDEKAAVEYQARHLWPYADVTPAPKPKPKTDPATPKPKPPTPEAPPQPPETKDEDVLDEILNDAKDKDEPEDLEDENLTSKDDEGQEDEEEDEEEEDEEEEEEDEEEEEEDREQLLKELKAGKEDKKTWNNYKWLMDIASRLEYFDEPGVQKKDKETLQEWLSNLK